MDDPGITPAAHAGALRGLARLNRASGIQRSVYDALKPFISEQPLRVLDVAAGSGDLITGLARRADHRGRPVRFTGCDISDFACRSIRERARSLPPSAAARIDAVRCDVLSESISGSYDIVMCHLFLHHLDGPDIVSLLKWARQTARLGVVITDLRRTRLGYALAWLASRMLTRSPVVRADALLSVRAALTIEELREMAIDAGYDDPCIRTIWPQRMLLTWRARS